MFHERHDCSYSGMVHPEYFFPQTEGKLWPPNGSFVGGVWQIKEIRQVYIKRKSRGDPVCQAPLMIIVVIEDFVPDAARRVRMDHKGR